ncbi:MAG: N-acetyltransferase [bacterium]
MNTMRIKKAVVKDIPAIYKIINNAAKKDLMLPRAFSELYENLQCYFAAKIDSKVVGCCALQISWKDLAEIKSLAVDNKFQKKGIGRLLVRACLDEAKVLGAKKIFCLTYVSEYFSKFGFRKISKHSLPHKVWGECVRCPHFPDCNEIPMIKKL